MNEKPFGHSAFPFPPRYYSKSRRFNKNAPKAKIHKPKKGKGVYNRFKQWLKEVL